MCSGLDRGKDGLTFRLMANYRLDPKNAADVCADRGNIYSNSDIYGEATLEKCFVFVIAFIVTHGAIAMLGLGGFGFGVVWFGFLVGFRCGLN